ncbi:MAG: DUF3570 domain-containing protein [Puia sp.]|nr:DUF3570 domain-containing protein [Puia sp.]
MRRICLTVIGLFVRFLQAFSQFYPVVRAEYSPRSLKLDEVNLVSSYYWQNGDHSAVTGGKGTEQGTDLANGVEVKWIGYDQDTVRRSLVASVGVDYHTAASQANVSQTGASKSYGKRIYPSLNWSVENLRKGTRFEAGAYYSGEYSYHSLGLDAGYAWKTKRDGEFDVKINGFYDRVKLIYPSELRPGTVIVTSASGSGSSGIPSDPRVTLDGSFSFMQVINGRMQGSIATDLVFQSGELSLPFHRVYFQNGSEAVELLPSTRLKLPIGFRLNYFLGDNIILRSYYRIYADSWGIVSHTASLEIPVKINPFFSVSPFYRYYTQTAARYFAPYGKHGSEDAYYTSNYSLSAFNAQFFGTGFRLALPKGLWGTPVKVVEFRYGHYTQTTDLVSDIVSMNLTFK